jgi:hypothetical protein
MLVGALAVTLLALPAAAAVECPRAGAGGMPAVATDWKDSDFPLDADDITSVDKIDAILQRVRKDQPGISYPSLVNALTAAYCPIVVRQPNRTDAEKRAQLTHFDTLLQQRIAAAQSAARDQILAEVPLSAKTMNAVTTAAANAHETPAQWMADVVGKAAAAK